MPTHAASFFQDSVKPTYLLNMVTLQLFLFGSIVPIALYAKFIASNKFTIKFAKARWIFINTKVAVSKDLQLFFLL